jgi:hypothetical protein
MESQGGEMRRGKFRQLILQLQKVNCCTNKYLFLRWKKRNNNQKSPKVSRVDGILLDSSVCKYNIYLFVSLAPFFVPLLLKKSLWKK